MALFFLVCFLASIVGAISGIGGGIIIKPVLELATEYSVEVISFLSGCTVLSMAVVSLLRRGRRGGDFDARRGTMLAVGSAAGGLLGKLLLDGVAGALGSGVLGATQSAVLLLMMAGLLVCQKNQQAIRKKEIASGLICACLGGAMGLLSAFLGIGGGPLNLAVLTYFLSMDNKKASLHSIYIILFSQTASLLLTFARGNLPDFPPLLLLPAIAGGILGALTGSTLNKRMTNQAVGRLYSALLVFVLCLSGYNLAMYML